MKKKKPIGAFQKFYNIWMVVTISALIVCLLYYFFVERVQ